MNAIDNIPAFVPAVTLYGDFISRSLPIREAIKFNESHNVALMLGRMREGYLGREAVTLDDLNCWAAHEEDSAAEWRSVEDGERFDAEVSR